MKILVACEESQAVCIELRALWHEAYSCDILPCSWWHPEWHIQGDVLKTILPSDWGYWQKQCVNFVTQDDTYHILDENGWDMMIAFPPCTYLTNAWMCNLTRKNSDDEYRRKRNQSTQEAFEFVMALTNAPIEKIAIENPVWYINTHFRKPDQIIHPYQFWHSVNKKTCLWLKNLPKLIPTEIVEQGAITVWDGNGKKISQRYKDTLKQCKGNLVEVSKLRSKTFPWIARAMATQRTQ